MSEVKVYHVCVEHDLYDGPHSVQIKPDKDIMDSKEVVLKSDYDSQQAKLKCQIKNVQELDAENRELKQKLHESEAALTAEREARQLAEARLEVCKDRIREQVHYDSANYLRGTSGYSPSAVEAEVKRRMDALDAKLAAVTIPEKGDK